MRGIVLAGGTGSRLWPLTIGISKQLLPIYNKPLIFYPISTLMLGGIREFLIITTPNDRDIFERVLGNGDRFGIQIDYRTQPRPEGLAQAITIGEDFVGNENVALILGDNFFYGTGLGNEIRSLRNINGAHIFGYCVNQPNGYGIAELGINGKIKSIEEKPIKPKSNIAITGLYLYDNSVFEIVKNVKPSSRGELEISTLNQLFLEKGNIDMTVLGRGTTWFDAGTFESLYAANTYVKVMEERQGTKIGCLEEISWRNGWTTNSQLSEIIKKLGDSPYAEYLKSLLSS